jgi:hypothetical protein
MTKMSFLLRLGEKAYHASAWTNVRARSEGVSVELYIFVIYDPATKHSQEEFDETTVTPKKARRSYPLPCSLL